MTTKKTATKKSTQKKRATRAKSASTEETNEVTSAETATSAKPAARKKTTRKKTTRAKKTTAATVGKTPPPTEPKVADTAETAAPSRPRRRRGGGKTTTAAGGVATANASAKATVSTNDAAPSVIRFPSARPPGADRWRDPDGLSPANAPAQTAKPVTPPAPAAKQAPPVAKQAAPVAKQTPPAVKQTSSEEPASAAAKPASDARAPRDSGRRSTNHRNDRPRREDAAPAPSREAPAAERTPRPEAESAKEPAGRPDGERAGREDRPRRRRRRGGAGRSGAPAAERDVAQPPVPASPPPVAREAEENDDDLNEQERRLSPSQKRRLRRRRRAERERAESGSDHVIELAAAPIVEEDDLEDLGVELREDVEDAVLDEEDDDDEEDYEPAVAEVTLEDRPRERGRRRRPHYRDDEAVDDETAADTPVVPRQMIINVVPGEECRIAILANNRLDEIYLERASAENHVGNIYKGVVTNVEPSIQAAFVDFGLGKNGFLHISDLHPKYFPRGSHPAEKVGRKMPRRTRPPIQQCLRRGQEVIVQISKEGIGTKGPTLNTYLSIPGRYLVMMPGMRKLGVSRRIEDEDARGALKSVLAELELPEDMGFIARTAAIGRSQRELQGDLRYLQRLWERVEKRREKQKAPAELYRETDLVIRTIRDVFSSDITEILVDDEATAERARDFLSVFSPKSADTVKSYDQTTPIFHKYQIEAELERLHSRHVPLKSGGSLVIDSTEALVAIDVNSGRFRTEADAEQTAFKINLEAADEVTRQLRLRDLGGVIVCDFIDMREERHKREIERRLIRNLRAHKERAKVLRMSSFGMIEMTRQRQRASLTRSVYQDCHHCRGTGLVKTAESVALDVMRLLQLSVTRDAVQNIEVIVSPEVAEGLLNRKRAAIYHLETTHERGIQIRPSGTHSLDQVVINCLDGRGRPVAHP